MAASLKERMKAFKKATDDEEKDYKTLSGNTEANPEKVGKLNHSYMEKDDKAAGPVKRNFTVKKTKQSSQSREEEQEKGTKQPGKLKNSFLDNDKKKKGNDDEDDFDEEAIDRKLAGIRLSAGSAAPPPKKSLDVLGRKSIKAHDNSVNAYSLVKEKSRAEEVKLYLDQLSALEGDFKSRMKRLSIRDNDIVQSIHKVIGNDPKQTSIKISDDTRFGHVKASLVQDFADSIRKNLYLNSLTIRGAELGNTFLESLSSAIMDNVTLEEIDLSRNHLTHDAMVEFCQALEHNQTIKTVYLQTQLSPLFEKGIDKVLASMEKNNSVKKMKIDFQGGENGEGQRRLKEILQRNSWNKDGYEKPNPDDLLVQFLKEEVIRAKELAEQRALEEELEEVREGDWGYLYELSVLFDTFKLEKEDDEVANKVASTSFSTHESSSSSAGKHPLTGLQGFPSDGSFLTEEFITDYLKEDVEKGGLVFDFCQFRLFKTFPPTSPDRENIVNIFVYQLLHHPRQHEFTGINMAATGCGNDFWMKIRDEVLEDGSLLPNVHLINSETNFLTENGIVAIADMIKSDECMRYIQAVKLENQKALLSSKAERALARALCVNLSVVRFSLRVRNLQERDQCNKYVIRNIDFLRQARRHHKLSTGTLKERKRNQMEQFFDKVAANNESITEVNISADIKYLGLSDAEKVKSAQAFANNTYVTKVTMNALQVGDDFAIALGTSLETNETIEKLVIESNAFTGEGFKGLFAGLGKNNSVLELRAKHQTKSCTSVDEQALPGLLEPNTAITKISLDLRNSAVTMRLDKIGNRNRDSRRRLSKKTPAEGAAAEAAASELSKDDESSKANGTDDEEEKEPVVEPEAAEDKPERGLKPEPEPTTAAAASEVAHAEAPEPTTEEPAAEAPMEGAKPAEESAAEEETQRTEEEPESAGEEEAKFTSEEEPVADTKKEEEESELPAQDEPVATLPKETAAAAGEDEAEEHVSAAEHFRSLKAKKLAKQKEEEAAKAAAGHG